MTLSPPEAVQVGVPEPVAADSPKRRLTAKQEMLLGILLISAVSIFGALVAGDRGPLGIDRWGMSLVSHSRHGSWRWVSEIRSPLVLGAAASICALYGLRHGWRTALMCLIGPFATFFLVEALKPGFGRLYTGVPTYPSGSVAAVAAVAAVAVIVTEPRWKAAALAAASAFILAMGIAVVALRWHYPTDAVAGAATGIAVVLVVDGLLRHSNRARPS